jgi:hypothetical protein
MDGASCPVPDKPASTGSHICSIYLDKQQQMRVAIPFLIEGVMRHEKCVYVIDESTIDEIRFAFSGFGLPSQQFIDTKQLQIITKHESYLRNGTFDVAAMISLIAMLEKASVDEGYAGFRGTGEMTWALTDIPPDKLISYESELNTYLNKGQAKILCQYNEQRFPELTLTDVVRTHPNVHLYGNGLYENQYFFTPPQFMRMSDGFAGTAYREMVKEIMETAV